MKQRRLLMGMPITVEIIDSNATDKIFDAVFDYFQNVDNRFSLYKKTSEISKINRGEIQPHAYSKEMQTIFRLAEQTKQITNGFFDISHNGIIDPSGIVKGWAIYQTAKRLKKKGLKNFYVEAGGDIQVTGKNSKQGKWSVGIQNPFDQKQIIKVVYLKTEGIATSGTYIRGQHIYSPFALGPITDVVSMTVIAENIYEADRFATTAFAMGKEGIHFIEKQKNMEGYMIHAEGIATYTSGFEKFCK